MPVPDKSRKQGPKDQESWTLGAEGDYAKDELWTVERGLSLIVAAGWVGLAVYERGGGYAVRAISFYVIPLASIWWPEVMRRFQAEHDPATNTSDPLPVGCFRWVAWIWLLIPGMVWLVLKTVK